MKNVTFYIGLILVSFTVSLNVVAQPGTTIEIKKPEKYEKRTLTSEKTGDKKFTFPKRVTQNAFTHYNYYFNANTIIKNIVEEAKGTFVDNYTKLLPFYNYSLDVTANSSDLDSVIYKCNAGILLHDLRSDWVDNMYLLMGQAYFYRKNFDSADQVFRYINYAFAPKEAGGYDIPVGSSNGTTSSTFTVATKESSSLSKKLFSTPPSRNDALLWQAKNYIETGYMGEAAGIMEILRNDPVFPARLKSDLNETLAYWYYKQGVYDSAASHLVKALDVADDKEGKARMEFLAGQLFQVTGNNEEAVKWYGKSASDTKNPVMEVYANLNSIKAYRDSSDKMLQDKLDNLFKMAHRDKYTDNKDIIYYAIAQVELERKDTTSAEQMLKKSIFYNTDENPDQRSQSFLLLADINYDRQKYVEAKNFYDSLSLSSITDENDKNRINLRQPGLTIIAENLAAIHVEDSLQTVAAMPKDKRDALIKKTVRLLRKQQGLKEDTEEININPAIQQQGSKDIFNTTAAGSDWYFNNLSLKSTGFNQFRQKWGDRPNTDNWRRMAAIKAEQASDNGDDPDDSDQNTVRASGVKGAPLPGKNVRPATNNVDEDGEITFDALLANLPLSEDQLKASNDKIADALFANGQAFQDKLEDYPSAIASYESLLKKYPGNNNQEQALFNLYYCYNKIGRTFSADSVRNALAKNFPDSKTTAKLINPKATQVKENDPATAKYKDIYNLFIEGKFEEAKDEKAKADSVYGNSYWTPQLLYIESIFYVSRKEDSTAIEKLTSLKDLNPQSPLAEKATTMIDVLQRRSEIEEYLTNLQITRNDKEDAAPVVDLTPVRPTIQKTVITRDSVVNKNVTQPAKTKVDTTSGASIVIKNFEFVATDSQYVAIVLNKVDPVYINEAKNAFNRYNQVTYYNQKLTMTPVKLDDQYNVVLIGPFADAVAAMAYVDKTKPITTSRILPWLAADKYSYSIISQSNLDVLKETKDVDGYKKLLEKVLPGKF